MENIATCPNGHNYDPNIYDTCPYCPNSQGRTVMSNQQGPQGAVGYFSNMRTQIAGEHVDRTMVAQDMEENRPAPVHQGTMIYHPEQSAKGSFEEHNKKLVGYLTSYDISKQGVSFKVYEGKNLIGSDSKCDIVISNDANISGKHLTILYRNKVFRFRDEFSTNGTLINGKMQEEGVLEGQAVIKLGTVRLIFTPIPLALIEEE